MSVVMPEVGKFKGHVFPITGSPEDPSTMDLTGFPCRSNGTFPASCPVHANGSVVNFKQTCGVIIQENRTFYLDSVLPISVLPTHEKRRPHCCNGTAQCTCASQRKTCPGPHMSGHAFTS
ncbi:hypothetical protein Bbelb_096920 [Branchiostoma belcheri]|nr:hypothetical protein Bbelb_096920 [Branchiostoma belcheri]